MIGSLTMVILGEDGNEEPYLSLSCVWSPDQKSSQLAFTYTCKIDNPVGLFVKTLMPPLQGKQSRERKKKKDLKR